ncbi:MAG: alpha-L-fucosidase [Anaerolineae bacterium]
MSYEPTLESVQQHTVPDWFHDAKLGIFVHWGLYSVPAWAPLSGELGKVIAEGGWDRWFAENPYAEWYMNSIRIDGSPSQRHHVETYGPGFDYRDFVPMFDQATQAWDPGAWADLFRQVGARYVVLTTKHHDGFLLWPSEHPNPFYEHYHAQRNLVGELTDAVRRRGMEMGLYYSGGIDWTFNDKVVQDISDLPKATPQQAAYVEYANNHWRELTDRYGPALMWNDIAYPAAADLNALFSYYYNHVPEGVINDRFSQRFSFSEGQIGGSQHYDFRTPEYTSFAETTPFKWEATRGIGASFGYNRNEGPEQYLSVSELVRSFVDIVSKNGNLLLNVGPTADGTIPDLQHERLEGLGRWLDVNGEAIFRTRPWVTAEGRTAAGTEIRFTKGGDSLYAILMDTPAKRRIAIEGLHAMEGSTVALLGHQEPLPWEQHGEAMVVTLPPGLPAAPAHALAITPLPEARDALRVSSGPLGIDSKLKEILKNEVAKAILQERVGEMVDSPQLEMAMGLSLRQVAQFAPNLLTPEVLDEIDRELKSI